LRITFASGHRTPSAMLQFPNSRHEKSPSLAKEIQQIPVTVAGARALQIPPASSADLEDLQRRFQEQMGDKGSLEIADVLGTPSQSGVSLSDAVSAGRTPLNAAPSGTTPARGTSVASPRGNTPEETPEMVMLAKRMNLVEGRLDSQRNTVDVAIERLTQDLLAAVEVARDRSKKEAGRLEKRIDNLEERLQVESRNCEGKKQAEFSDEMGHGGQEKPRGCMKNKLTEPKAFDENAQRRLSLLEERCTSLESHLTDMQSMQLDRQDRVLQRYENQAAGLDRLRVENSTQGQSLLWLESRLQEVEAACGTAISENKRTSAEVRRMVSSSARSCSPPREVLDTFNELTLQTTSPSLPSMSAIIPRRSQDSTPSFAAPLHSSSTTTSLAEEQELRGPASQSRVSLPQDQKSRASPLLSPRKGTTLVSGGSLRPQGLAPAVAGAQEGSVSIFGSSPRENRLSGSPSSPAAVVYRGLMTDRRAGSMATASPQSPNSSAHSASSLMQKHPGAGLGPGTDSAGSGSESWACSERARARGVCVRLGRTGRASYLAQESGGTTSNFNRKSSLRHNTEPISS